jgi:hypothetical protein
MPSDVLLMVNNPGIAVAAVAGAPIGSLVMNLAPALAPAGIAMLLLSVLSVLHPTPYH